MAQGRARRIALWLLPALALTVGLLLMFVDPCLGAAVAWCLFAVTVVPLAWVRRNPEDRVRVTIGKDGLLVERRGRTLFHPWSDIRDLYVAPDDRRYRSGSAFYVVRSDGTREILGAIHDTAEAALPLVELARLWRAAYAAGEPPASLAALLLGSDPRDAGGWFNELRKLRLGSRDYRSMAIDDGMLWSVLEEPRSPSSVRVGAAAALGVHRDEEARQRLRVAASTCASPELRETFEAIASAESDDEVERVLAPRVGHPGG
jgi:hypothetical protein